MVADIPERSAFSPTFETFFMLISLLLKPIALISTFAASIDEPISVFSILLIVTLVSEEIELFNKEKL